MNKRFILSLALFLAVALGAGILLVQHNQSAAHSTPPSSALILFYGDTCPHCIKVEQFITANHILQTIPLAEKEVFHNAQNAAELQQKAALCGTNTQNIGVPFLWDGRNGANHCILGDQDIITFLSSTTNK